MAKRASGPTAGGEHADDGNLTGSVNFEAAQAELEALVTRMESGELTLDESLKAFERGVLLARQCQAELEKAELRVQALTGDGTLVELDADPPDDA